MLAEIKGKAEKAENALTLTAGSAHGTREAYKIMKEITGEGKRKKEALVRSKNGTLLSSDEDIRKTWVEHFCEVMNKVTRQQDELDIPEAEEDIELALHPFNVSEVERALRNMKRAKAPGYDGIVSEMIEVEKEFSLGSLCRFFNRIWETKIKPSEWETAILIKLPKKGDLTDCGNYRGISLTSHIMKLFSIIILLRIQDHVENILRDEQAGFRKDRSCCDQIFLIRHVIQQCTEFRVPLLLAFVDYKKAFDSVHRPVLWKILRHYGIPHKYIRIIQTLHEGSKCRANLDG